jgi:hypothetical protein
MSTLTKIAHDAPAMLLEGARVTRKLAQDNANLLTENDVLVHELAVHKLAMRMHERGLEPALSLNEKVAMLGNVDPNKFAAIEAAVEMSAGGFKLATLRVEEELTSASPTQKSPGELGSSAHYDKLDDIVRSIG